MQKAATSSGVQKLNSFKYIVVVGTELSIFPQLLAETFLNIRFRAEFKHISTYCERSFSQYNYVANV